MKKKHLPASAKKRYCPSARSDADPLDGRDEDDFDSRSIKTRLKQRQRRENSCKISPEEYEFDFSASSERKEGQLLLALLERLKRKRICEYVTQQKQKCRRKRRTTNATTASAVDSSSSDEKELKCRKRTRKRTKERIRKNRKKKKDLNKRVHSNGSALTQGCESTNEECAEEEEKEHLTDLTDADVESQEIFGMRPPALEQDGERKVMGIHKVVYEEDLWEDQAPILSPLLQGHSKANIPEAFPPTTNAEVLGLKWEDVPVAEEECKGDSRILKRTLLACNKKEEEDTFEALFY